MQSPSSAVSVGTQNSNKSTKPQNEYPSLIAAAIEKMTFLEKKFKRKIIGKTADLAPEQVLMARFLLRMSLTSLILFAQAVLSFTSFSPVSLLFIAVHLALLYLVNKRDFGSVSKSIVYGPALISLVGLLGDTHNFLMGLSVSFVTIFTYSLVVLTLFQQIQSYGLLILTYVIHCTIHNTNVHGVLNLLIIGSILSLSASQFVSSYILKTSRDTKVLFGKIERREKKLELIETEKKGIDERLSALASELRVKTEELSLAVNSREIFLNTVSSELRNPLNSLIGYIDLIQMELKDSSALENLENAKHCSELLLCLINNLLDGAKIHAGKLDLQPQPYNIFWFIEKLWAVASPNIRVKNLNGIILVSKNVPPVLEFDQHRLMQICQNLLNNSIKFTSKGYVKVRFSWTTDQVRESPALGNRGLFHRNVVKRTLANSATMSFLPERIGAQRSLKTQIFTSKTSNDLPIPMPKSVSLDVESIQARKRFKEYLGTDKKSNFSFKEQEEMLSEENSSNSASHISESVKSIAMSKIPSSKNSYDSALRKYHHRKYDENGDPSLPPISDSESDESTSVSDQITKHSSNHASLKDIRMKGVDFEELNFNVRRFKKEVHTRQLSPPAHDLGEMDVIREEVPERGKLFIEITDSGCGISREAQDRIFSPFEQGDSSITRKFGGSGMGLYITKQLVEKMGGNIKIESELDVGSYILISIPLKTSFDNVTPSFTSLLDGMPDENRNKKQALVVDDSQYNRDILEKFLKKYKMEVKMAKNGDEAVQIYSKYPENYFSLITMDLEMPVMDGLTACKMIRKLEKENNISKKIPIAIISGNIEERDHCLDPEGPIAADYYFRKPVTFKDLDSFVPKLLKEEGSEKQMKFSRSKGNILIVDDDILGIQFLQNFFKKYGCECSLATDGEVAVEMVQKSYSKLDLILFNCEVPKNTRMQAALEIKKILESNQMDGVKMVLLSGRIDEELRRLCDNLKLTYLLSKPVKVLLLKQLLGL